MLCRIVFIPLGLVIRACAEEIAENRKHDTQDFMDSLVTKLVDKFVEQAFKERPLSDQSETAFHKSYLDSRCGRLQALTLYSLAMHEKTWQLTADGDLPMRKDGVTIPVRTPAHPKESAENRTGASTPPLLNERNPAPLQSENPFHQPLTGIGPLDEVIEEVCMQKYIQDLDNTRLAKTAPAKSSGTPYTAFHAARLPFPYSRLASHEPPPPSP